MKFIHTANSFVSGIEYDPEEIEPVVQYVAENAKESTPYNCVNLLPPIIGQCNAHGIEIDLLAVAGGVFQELVQRHGWYTVSEYRFLAYGPTDTILRSVLYGSMISGLSCGVPAISEVVEEITGEQPDADTLRKNLQRLVNAGKFARTEKGVYRREVKGL